MAAITLALSLFWSQAFSVLAIKDVLQLKEVLKTEEKSEKEGTEIYKRNSVAYDLMKNALKHVGTAYVWGGESSDGYDCSGFVRAVFKETGLNLIDGYGMIPRETGFHGDSGNSWKTLVDKMEVGDEITFSGRNKELTYELAFKDCTYENDLPLPEGSIILNRGHIRLMLYQAEDLMPEAIHDYILERYGIDCVGKTQENCDKIHVMNETNHNIDVESYGNEDGDIDEGVIVCNNDMGVNGGDHYLAAALIPKADKKELNIRVQGKETGTVIKSGIIDIFKDKSCLELLAEKEVTSEVMEFTLPQDTYYVQHLSEGPGYLNDDDVYEVKLAGVRNVDILKEESNIRVDVPETEGVEFQIEEYSQKANDYAFVAKVIFNEGESVISNYIVRQSGKVQKAKNAIYYTDDNAGKFKLIGYKGETKVFEKNLLIGKTDENEVLDPRLQEDQEQENQELDTAFLNDSLPKWDDAKNTSGATKVQLLKETIRSEKAIVVAKDKWKNYHDIKNAADTVGKPKSIKPSEKDTKTGTKPQKEMFRKKIKYQE